MTWVNEANDKFDGISNGIISIKESSEKLDYLSQEIALKNSKTIELVESLAALAEENAASTEEASASVEEQSSSMTELADSGSKQFELAKKIEVELIKF